MVLNLSKIGKTYLWAYNLTWDTAAEAFVPSRLSNLLT